MMALRTGIDDGPLLPSPGHNLASPLDLIRERVEKLAVTCNEWSSKVAEIADEDTARRCDDFLNQINAELKRLGDEEQAEKKPHRDAIKAIGLAYGPVRLLLEKAKSLIAPKRLKWLQRVDAALAAEKKRQAAEAERLAREAEKASAKVGTTVESHVRAAEAQRLAEEAAKLAAGPQKRAQVRGQYSSRAAALRTLRSAEVEDVLLCFCYFQDHPDVREVLTRLASAEVRGGAKEIPGCRVVEKEIAA